MNIRIPSIKGNYELTYGQSVNTHQHIAQLNKKYGCLCVGNHYGSGCDAGGQWKPENIRIGDKAYLEYETRNGLETIHHSGTYIAYLITIVKVINGRFYHAGQEVKPFDTTDLIVRSCVGSDSSHNYIVFFYKEI